MTVLIVDDDIPTTQLIRQSIDWRLFGITEVYIAHNANSAKNLLDEKKPELVLSDIEMPKGSGIDVLRYAREKKYSSQFIILTCHADFSYASQAIRYEAIDYLIKPLDTEKMQSAVAKAIEKISWQKEQENISNYKEQWLDNKHRRESEFWKEVLFSRISINPDSIVKARKTWLVELSIDSTYTMVLFAVKQEDIVKEGWTNILFTYALRNLIEEIVQDGQQNPMVQNYFNKSFNHILCVFQSASLPHQLTEKINQLLQTAQRYLQCEITAYLKDDIKLQHLASTREELNDINEKNICAHGVLLSNEKLVLNVAPTTHTLDLQKIERMLREERGAEAINILRKEIECLANANQLNHTNMHQIHEDYIQLVYAVLYANNIQAHQLFSDEAMKRLFENAERSVFDMMKWASGITEKMLYAQKEIRKTKTVIDKIKMYIDENYSKDISRKEIAASVFLSPDYVAKLFKADTGIYLKDYVNDVRIHKAKELLLCEDKTISEIASHVGIDNFSYFSTLFKKATGFSPREYKQQKSSTTTAAF